MSVPKIVLLHVGCSKYAEQVGANLSSEFGMDNVSIRSALVPIKRLLDMYDGSNQLWVLLGDDSLETVLEREVSFPVMSHTDPELSADVVALRIAKLASLSSEDLRARIKHVSAKKQQKLLIDDAQERTKTPKYAQAIETAFDKHSQITGDAVGLPDRLRGKVRDRYVGESKLALVTTDRQSGFDRMLALVPFKGAVLNLTSAYWFEKTKHIIPNHLLAVPHPNVSIVKKCKPFPIEFVVRSYVTGSTSTSIWKNYQNGVRNYCGHELPEGLVKNQKLWKNLLTPTTKEEEHDRPISCADIVAEKWMTQEDLDVCSKAALAVFALGQQVAAQRGLVLVDTKYEFGRDQETGEVLLIDEVHTPDSSRYWLASTYKERMAAGQEPDNIDKEFLRLWFREQCDPYNDDVLPDAPKDLVMELARRYISLYEMITWKDFDFETGASEETIANAIRSHLT